VFQVVETRLEIKVLVGVNFGVVLHTSQDKNVFIW